jgi:prophage tail gpP-like protein
VSDEVALFLESERLTGWTSVSVVRSLENVANGFRISKSEKEPDFPTRRSIRKGDACEITVGGERIIAGYVSRVAPSYDRETHTVAVDGWDATADLVRCSIEKCPSNPIDLETLAAELCAPFEIPVEVEVDTGAAFATFTTEPGETVFAALERAARYRGVVLVSDGLGGLRITLPGARSATAEIRKGNHVLRANSTADDAERYASVTVESQRETGWGGAAGAPLSATVSDASLRRHLPLVMIAEEPPTDRAALEARAQRELNLRAARGQRISYTLPGWRTEGDSGALWSPGELVKVTDEWLGISRELLLSAATFTLDGSGKRSQLNLLRPEAFDLRKLEEPSDEGPEYWETE